jgi:ribonuclease Z
VVFLTHLHSDHFDGLATFGLLRWTGASAKAPMPLYGPEGIERVAAGLREAYTIDSTYRVAHHGADTVPPSGFGFEAKPFLAPMLGASAVVYEKDGVRISAFGVDHGPIKPSLGYRIDHQGRSIVISGDTKLCECVEKVASGTDLLIHEALSPRLTRVLGKAAQQASQAGTAKILHDIENYHTTPPEVAGLATRAKVKAVALTHIAPTIPLKALEPIFLDGADKAFDGPLWVMADGDIVSIANNGAITRSNGLRRR